MPVDILVVGSLNIDLVFRAQRLPRLGETLMGSDFHAFSGGKGANQAVAAAKLGARVSIVGKLGMDVFGSSVEGSLNAAGVDLRHLLRVSSASTGVAMIVIDFNGQNSILAISGANSLLEPKDIDAVQDEIAHASIIIAQLEIPLPTVSRAFELAHKYKVHTIFNPAPAQPVPAELFQIVDTLILNEIEAELLSGHPVFDISSAVRSGNLIQEKGPRTVIITLGEKGVVLIGDRNEPELRSPLHIPAWRVDMVDATAAGDAFIGAYAVAMLERRAPVEATRWANAAAALTVTRLGAQNSLPVRRQVDNFYSTLNRNAKR